MTGGMIFCIIMSFALTLSLLLSIDLSYDLSPNYFYEKTNMNMFGCWLVTILLACLVPVYYIIMIIYWLCHIGREEYEIVSEQYSYGPPPKYMEDISSLYVYYEYVDNGFIPSKLMIGKEHPLFPKIIDNVKEYQKLKSEELIITEEDFCYWLSDNEKVSYLKSGCKFDRIKLTSIRKIKDFGLELTFTSVDIHDLSLKEYYKKFLS